MRYEAERVLLSATDLAGHQACQHLTSLEHAAARGLLRRPMFHDARLALLVERGLLHEAAYVEHLRQAGRSIADLRGIEGRDAVERTRRAAAAGAEVIVQAALERGRWHGRADVLLRVDGASDLGPWLYEVADTKLARETRGGTVLQLCVYADLLAAVQGVPAPRMHVVKPGADFPTETFRWDDYAAYHRSVQRRVEAAVDAAAGAETAPEPVEHCAICRWWSVCDARWRDEDHLSLVAGMSRLHADELRRQGVSTLERLGSSPSPLAEAPQRGRREAYAHLQAQAAVQLRGRPDRCVHELMPPEPGRGLALLPEPSAGDVYLDFEGDPHVPDGGLEYLLGYAYRDAGGALGYTGLWALERAAEKAAFERFIDFVHARLERHPGLHVYHFAAYEPAALKRLASRHATRERELDVLLRALRFVDLHTAVRQGVRASVESYSLKMLEAFFGFERAVDLRGVATPALRAVERALELGLAEEIASGDRDAVEGYNRDDCLSLAYLQRWLEERRAELAASGAEVARPAAGDGAESDAQELHAGEVEVLFDALVAGLPQERGVWSEEQRARWLLAHLLDYYRREKRVGWWEYHARRDLDDEDLWKDRKALVGLELVQVLDPGKRGAPLVRYRFQPQEVGLKVGDDLHDARADITDGLSAAELGEVTALDTVRGLLEVKHTKKSKDRRPRVVHVCESVPLGDLPDALHATARIIAEHGFEGEGVEHRASRDLLLGLPPRRRTPGAPLRAPGEDLVGAELRVARDLDAGVLAVQGPPGTGKSWTGARVICALAREGKRVGVCAVSHKVIRSLLEQVLEASRADGGPPLRATAKLGKGREPDPHNAPPGLSETKDKAAVLAALDAGEVAGDVAWLWASKPARGTLDYLVVDEAGQMSLAQVLSALRGARNLILLGDPQQLQQPQRGAHPEGADVSALAHLLGGRATMPADRGIFLDQTWRLHPRICDYTSELYYERRLTALPGLERQALTGPGPFAGSGLYFVPVEHAGNQAHASEEVEVVRALVARLLETGHGWIDRHGAAHPLRPADVLVVAPYNAQVAALARCLPAGVPVGTVDRFQGQQAPVVVYSLTSSSALDAPRGLSFLYDPNRLNVATSRARCACILVGSPRLLEPDCRTPEEMRWVNGLCRYAELATWVPVPHASPSAAAARG